MLCEVKLPKHGLNMTKGILTEFLVQPGDVVKVGDILCNVETDKATLEVESNFDGTVEEILVEEGDEIPVGQVIITIISEEQEKTDATVPHGEWIDQEVKLPKHGLNMTKGMLTEFLVKPGESVQIGDILCNVETDKAVLDVESPFAGVIKEYCVEEGDDVPVGQAILIITSVLPKAVTTTIPAQEEKACPPVKDGKKVQATPAARKLAKEHNLDLSLIPVSNKTGIIETECVLAHLAQIQKDTIGMANQNNHQTEYLPYFSTEGKEKIELSSVKKISAQRLSYSFRETPHFYLSLEANLTNLLVRKDRLAEAGEKISLSDFLTLAVAKALAKYPLANGSFWGEAIYLNPQINIGLATATPKGLLVPVLFDADKKSLSQIAQERKELIKKTLDGKLSLSEMENGTFTITNLGVFGIQTFDAIINPPQAAILAVGAIEKKLVLHDDNITPVAMLNLRLAIDHRVMDGSEAAQFFGYIKQLLEDPPCLE